MLSVPVPPSRRRIWFEVESEPATRSVSIAGGWDSVGVCVLLSGLQDHSCRWVRAPASVFYTCVHLVCCAQCTTSSELALGVQVTGSRPFNSWLQSCPDDGLFLGEADAGVVLFSSRS